MLPYRSADMLKAMRRDHGLGATAYPVAPTGPDRRHRRGLRPIIAGALLALRTTALPR